MARTSVTLLLLWLLPSKPCLSYLEISPLQWHFHEQRPSLVAFAGWGKHFLCLLCASIILSSHFLISSFLFR